MNILLNDYCNLRCKYCLPAGTQILLPDFTTANIEDIDIGDTVLGFDEFAETKGAHRKVYPVEVTERFTREAETIKLTLSSGQVLEVTPEHPLLANRGSSKYAWREAGKFKVGQTLMTIPEVRPAYIADTHKPAVAHKGYLNYHNTSMLTAATVVKIEPGTKCTVYNLETESHTYVANSVAVHNCFAHDAMYKQPEKNNLSMENLEIILDFFKKNNIRNVRLIGGEPTLHPQFKEILTRLANDPFFEHIHIFSNMTFGDSVRDHIWLISHFKPITILPNCNECKETGDKHYQRLLDNIAFLTQDPNRKIISSVGINIYSPDMDYSYIFDIANQFDIRDIRWSITTPNFPITEDFDVKEYFRSFVPLLRNFFTDGIHYGRKMHLDCNTLPICVFDDADFRYLHACSPESFVRGACNPILDIKPNLEVLRCFGCSEKISVKLTDFATPVEIINYFNSKLKHLHHQPLFPECVDCPVYRRNNSQSCACINYRVVRSQPPTT